MDILINSLVVVWITALVAVTWHTVSWAYETFLDWYYS